MIKINPEAIRASCRFRSVSTQATLGDFEHELDYAKETTNMALSYEAALILWDMARWPGNRIVIFQTDKDNVMLLPKPVVDVRITVARRMMQVIGPKTKKGWPVKNRWIGWRLYFDTRNLIDPTIQHTLQGVGSKVFLAEILHDVINRPEPLRVHDTVRYQWVNKNKLMRTFK